MAKKKAAKRIPAAQMTSMANQILDDMKRKVEKGMGGKVFDKGVENALRIIMGPKIKRRLRQGGNWKKEKGHPLTVALHMGRIAALLSKTRVVDISVATAALQAVKSDEHCKRGASGGGDWCF